MKVKIISNYGSSAETEINNWLKIHPEIEIKSMQYQSAMSSGNYNYHIYHSVFIMYTEKDDSIKL